jgi:hypothetical protein
MLHTYEISKRNTKTSYGTTFGTVPKNASRLSGYEQYLGTGTICSGFLLSESSEFGFDRNRKLTQK